MGGLLRNMHHHQQGLNPYRRKLAADLEVALEDCRQALALDPCNKKAAHREVQCLEALRRQSGAEQGTEGLGDAEALQSLR